jgi:hypothetical protein
VSTAAAVSGLLTCLYSFDRQTRVLRASAQCCSNISVNQEQTAVLEAKGMYMDESTPVLFFSIVSAMECMVLMDQTTADAKVSSIQRSCSEYVQENHCLL